MRAGQRIRIFQRAATLAMAGVALALLAGCGSAPSSSSHSSTSASTTPAASTPEPTPPPPTPVGGESGQAFTRLLHSDFAPMRTADQTLATDGVNGPTAFGSALDLLIQSHKKFDADLLTVANETVGLALLAREHTLDYVKSDGSFLSQLSAAIDAANAGQAVPTLIKQVQQGDAAQFAKIDALGVDYGLPPGSTQG